MTFGKGAHMKTAEFVTKRVKCKHGKANARL
jgi:hypothetical protein